MILVFHVSFGLISHVRCGSILEGMRQTSLFSSSILSLMRERYGSVCDGDDKTIRWRRIGGAV